MFKIASRFGLGIWVSFEKFPNNFLKVNETILQDKTSFVQPEHRQIGYVFQSLNLFTHLSAEGNLKFASERSRAKPFVSESEVSEPENGGKHA